MESQGSADAVTKNSDPVPPPSLQDRIQTLTDVHNRLQTLRHVPTMLLRPPSASPLADFDREFAATFNSTPTHDFRALKEFQEVLCSDKVQEAMQAARASESADQSELGSSFRRESRKRKQPHSPVGSPQPYVPSPPRSSSLFASPEDDPPPMRVESLIEFVREFNQGNAGELKSPTASGTDATLPKCKLVIWSRTQTIRDGLKPASSHNANGGSMKLTSPVVLRFMIPDVLTAYISLIFTNVEDPLVVESVAAFGPRERLLSVCKQIEVASRAVGLSSLSRTVPTSHEDDIVASACASSDLNGGKSALMRGVLAQLYRQDVLVSYRGLFVDHCTSCQRVLSAEGHIPPVARVWGAEQPSGGPSTDKSTSNAESLGPPAQPSPMPATGDSADHAGGHWEPRHATCLYN